LWDVPPDKGLIELLRPPAQVVAKVVDRMMWHEWTETTDTKHGFEGGEICPSCRKDKASMKELPMKLLYIKEQMSQLGQPAVDRTQVFRLLLHRQLNGTGLETPEQPNIHHLRGKRDVLCRLPWNAEGKGDAVNVAETIRKVSIITARKR
jgi:hypothetical protein